MQPPLFHRFPPAPDWPPLTNHPRGFTVTVGTPQCRTWRCFSDEAGPALTYAGIWECTEGTFAFKFQHWEFFRMLSGRLVIRPEDGDAMTLGAGDALVMEPGFTGTWQVIETMRKHFVTRYVQA